MALIDINKNPSKGELLFFGLVFPVFFGVIGGVVYAATESLAVPQILWGVASVVTVLFFAVKPLQVPIYLGWIYLAFPIGWTVSHLLMVIVYYVVLSPLGIMMRLLGRDPMTRGFDKSRASYFVDHKAATTRRYFKQF